VSVSLFLSFRPYFLFSPSFFLICLFLFVCPFFLHSSQQFNFFSFFLPSFSISFLYFFVSFSRQFLQMLSITFLARPSGTTMRQIIPN
jgi:hypothetical protein